MKNFKRIVAWICALSFMLSMASSFTLAAGSENTITPLENSGLYVERTSNGNYLYGVPPLSTAKSVVNLLEGDCIVSGSGNVKTGDTVTRYVNGNAVDKARIIIKGDLHIDGHVNSKDVVRLKTYLEDPDASIEKRAADINGDGSVTYKDVEALSAFLTSSAISVKAFGEPDKTVYYAGEKFRSDGMFLKVTYDDGTSYAYADGFDVIYPSGTCFKAGDTYADLVYSGMSVRVAVTVKEAAEGDIVVQNDNIIYYTTPALPANAGETVDLSLYDVQLELDVTTDSTKITWSSSDLTIKNKKVTAPSSKGVYTLKAASGGISKTIYLIVKEKNETEYVLYQNDFSSNDMSDMTVLFKNSSNISISNGKLVLDSSSSASSSSCLLLPEYIGDFGDYTITANATIDSAINDQRWTSVMYRVQNSDYPYYQLCVRKNAAASNGVELAYRTTEAKWAYYGQTAGLEALKASSNYEFVIDANGANVAAYMNGEQLISTSKQTDYPIGRVGLQANCCKAVYDDIKITVVFRAPNAYGTATYTCPAIPANTSTDVRLSMYNVEFTQSFCSDKDDITWSSSDVTINKGNTVSITKSGVYKVTASSAGYSKTIYIVAKAPSDSEYVLYYNDFSKNDMTDLQIIQKTTDGSVKIENGKLVVAAPTSNSSFTRVLLPAYIGDFGDYTIVANATMTQSANDSRWMALMYRVCNNNYPYEQFCIRQNAANSNNNGVELAYTSASSTDWSYHAKGSYSTALNSATSYKFRMTAIGNSATGYINGTKVISTDSLTQVKGRVGLQNCGSTTAYDDIKITVEFSNYVSSGYTPGIADVQHTDTNIALAATVATEVKKADDLDKIKLSRPAVAIFSINSALQIIDENGGYICSIADGLNALEGKTVPAFRIDSSAEATAISNFINSNGIKDVLVVSKSVAQLSSLRSSCTAAKGILDATSSNLDLATLRENCNKASSRICLLPASRATQENSAYLSELATTVWYMADSDTETELYDLITSGAQGIVTSEPARLKECLGNTDIFLENSIIRPVNIIGHRGIPSKAPENTVTGTLLAAQNGANIIENDVYLTSDGVVVVMHDPTIDRTTNGSGNVESMTYAQLQKYVVDYYPGYSEKIPTLEEYFKAIKGKDINLFIEVKSQNTAIVPKIKALIEKYDILDQCCIITFHMAIMNEFHKQMPSISNGFLTAMTDLSKVMEYTSTFNCTFNPQQTAALTEEFMLDGSYRGITFWPWTLNSSSVFDTYFLMGTNGITTNYADFSSGYLKFLETEKSSYTVETGRKTQLNVYKETYAGSRTVSKHAEMVILSGDGNIYFDGSSIHAYADGVTTVLFRHSFTLNNGAVAYVYSQPVTITAN